MPSIPLTISVRLKAVGECVSVCVCVCVCVCKCVSVCVCECVCSNPSLALVTHVNCNDVKISKCREPDENTGCG